MIRVEVHLVTRTDFSRSIGHFRSTENEKGKRKHPRTLCNAGIPTVGLRFLITQEASRESVCRKQLQRVLVVGCMYTCAVDIPTCISVI